MILKENEPRIRLATTNDAGAIAQIYTYYSLNTLQNLETIATTAEDIIGKIESSDKLYPWLVAEKDHEVIGYAYAAPFRKKGGFNWCVETSVYIQSEFTKIGVGTNIYGKLLNILTEQGFANAYGILTLPNPGSVKLHLDFGFTIEAVLKNCGYKFNQWCDLQIMHLQLNNPALISYSPLNFSDIGL